MKKMRNRETFRPFLGIIKIALIMVFIIVYPFISGAKTLIIVIGGLVLLILFFVLYSLLKTKIIIYDDYIDFYISYSELKKGNTKVVPKIGNLKLRFKDIDRYELFQHNIGMVKSFGIRIELITEDKVLIQLTNFTKKQVKKINDILHKKQMI